MKTPVVVHSSLKKSVKSEQSAAKMITSVKSMKSVVKDGTIQTQ
jgi:hypothetical protein